MAIRITVWLQGLFSGFVTSGRHGTTLQCWGMQQQPSHHHSNCDWPLAEVCTVPVLLIFCMFCPYFSVFVDVRQIKLAIVSFRRVAPVCVCVCACVCVSVCLCVCVRTIMFDLWHRHASRWFTLTPSTSKLEGQGYGRKFIVQGHTECESEIEKTSPGNMEEKKTWNQNCICRTARLQLNGLT